MLFGFSFLGGILPNTVIEGNEILSSFSKHGFEKEIGKWISRVYAWLTSIASKSDLFPPQNDKEKANGTKK